MVCIWHRNSHYIAQPWEKFVGPGLTWLKTTRRLGLRLNGIGGGNCWGLTMRSCLWAGLVRRGGRCCCINNAVLGHILGTRRIALESVRWGRHWLKETNWVFVRLTVVTVGNQWGSTKQRPWSGRVRGGEWRSFVDAVVGHILEFWDALKSGFWLIGLVLSKRNQLDWDSTWKTNLFKLSVHTVIVKHCQNVNSDSLVIDYIRLTKVVHFIHDCCINLELYFNHALSRRNTLTKEVIYLTFNLWGRYKMSSYHSVLI